MVPGKPNKSQTPLNFPVQQIQKCYMIAFPGSSGQLMAEKGTRGESQRGLTTPIFGGLFSQTIVGPSGPTIPGMFCTVLFYTHCCTTLSKKFGGRGPPMPLLGARLCEKRVKLGHCSLYTATPAFFKSFIILICTFLCVSIVG